MTWHSGDHVIVRGKDWRVVRATPFSDCEALDLTASRARLRRTLLIPFDRPRAAAPPRPRVVSRRRWAQAVASLITSSFPCGGLQYCPPTIRLLPYQLEPALAMIRHGAIRLLIADDVGLGKTIEAGLIIREITNSDPLSRTMIVVPSSLREQWTEELRSLFELEVTNADAAWLRRIVRDLPRDVNPWSLPGIYLASMDFVKRAEALRPLEDLRWDLLVVDEAHGATLHSDRRAAIHALACRARRVVLLTATPHSGDDEQFAALCDIGAIGGGPPLVVFSRSRGDTNLADLPTRSRVLAVHLTEAERRMHRLLEEYTARIWGESQRRKDPGAELLATVLRKRALSSARSLAISLRRRMELLTSVPASPSQLLLPLDEEDLREDEAGDVLRARGLESKEDEQAMLSALAHAAETAAEHESKLNTLVRLIRRIREPAIVFSEYRDTAEWLRDELCRHGHQVCLLHGGLSPDERRRAISSFSAGGMFMVATDAASEGLNLQRVCRTVIHFELPWTPSRLHQRCGRVNRLGQTRRVHEIALVANDTAERFVLQPLVRRSVKSSSFSQTSIVRQLPETRVAAHVMAGAPLTLPHRAARPFTEMPLHDEARDEVRRLHLIRHLQQGRSPRPTQPAVISVATPKRHIPSLICVVELTLSDPAAGIVARDVIGLRFGIAKASSTRSAARLRATVEDLLAHQSELSSRVEQVLAVRLSSARSLRRPVIAAHQARERELQRELSSTARELVQAGLFDRRAMRAAAARTRAAEMLDDDQRTHHEGGPLEGRFDVRAVLIGGIP
jgi:superfamily II DNA or RNA helicase